MQRVRRAGNCTENISKRWVTLEPGDGGWIRLTSSVALKFAFAGKGYEILPSEDPLALLPLTFLHAC